MRIHIPHSRPTLDSNDAKAVLSVIKSGQISQGKEVSIFEKKMATFQKSKHAVAVNSGTSALHLSLLALNVKKGDNVIVPSFVCTALMNAVRYTGADVRIADVGKDFNICASSTRKKINKNTKAIIVPHMFGLPADLASLLKCGIPIIEDCAQAIGAKYKKKRVGSFGILSIFSFYATKMMTTGEGGMAVSDNQMLINRIRDLRDYDEKDDGKVRFNYKMTDMQAALGVHQLSRLPAWITKRKKIAQTYDKALRDSGFKLPEQYTAREHIYFRYVIQANSKSKLLNRLESKGICAASPIFKPLHQYLKLKGCLHAEYLMNKSISLPIYPSLSTDDIRYIIRCIKAER